MAHEHDEEKEAEEGMLADLARRWDPERLSKFVSERAGKGERLDVTTRQRYEKRLGADLGNVRIFSGPLAEEITKAHSAEALTLGSTGVILMRGSSQFAPQSVAGQGVLAHELTHVAQAKPMYQRHGEGGVSSAPLATEQSEREAEAVEHETMAPPSPGVQEQQKKENDKEKKAKLVEMVWDMIRENRTIYRLRTGRIP